MSIKNEPRFPAFPWSPLQGFQLIENPFMTDWYDLVKIKRTFGERFLTRPWMPWINFAYEIGPQVPAMRVVIMGNKIIGHPATIKGFIDAFTKLKVFDTFADAAREMKHG
jgi:hypothetical protein